MSKAYEILKVIAHKNAIGESITFAPDWGLGSGTLIFPDHSHSHFGADVEDDQQKAVEDFVNGLYSLLVEGKGLSVCHSELKQQMSINGPNEPNLHKTLSVEG